MTRYVVATLTGLLVVALVAPPAVAHHAPPPDDLWTPPSGAIPDTATYLYLESAGTEDRIGRGATYTYHPGTAAFGVAVGTDRVRIWVHGDEAWTGGFGGPSGARPLQEGYYHDVSRRDDPSKGYMDWSGEGRGCNEVSGWFLVDHVAYSDSGSLESLRLRFEQHCGHPDNPPLRGALAYDADHAEPQPSNPREVPEDLWEPDPELLPDAASFIYLESAPGDFIGRGLTYSYRGRNAVLQVTASDGEIDVAVHGDEWWHAQFTGPQGPAQLRTGHYAGLSRSPFHNPVEGGLSWSGEGRGCDELFGWFTIDEIAYVDGAIDRLRLRFEQRCEVEDAPPLHGLVAYDAGDVEPSPNPTSPVPDGLWAPDDDDLPPTSSYVHLVSESGDEIGQGRTFQYAPLSPPTFSIAHRYGRIQMHIDGEDRWHGNFEGTNEQRFLEPGYYGDLRRYPFHNRRLGGLSWRGDRSGCDELYGWFVVDRIDVEHDELIRLKLRFEQRCESPDAPPLRGAIAYSADGTWPDEPPDTSTDAGPADPTSDDGGDVGDGTGDGDEGHGGEGTGGEGTDGQGTGTSDAEGSGTDGANDDTTDHATGEAATRGTTDFAGAVILGGTAAVSDDVAARVQQLTGSASRRVWGEDRYRTAAAVVADAFPEPVDTVYVTTGADFPDALTGSAAAARVDAPVLLTAQDRLPAPTAEQLRRLQPQTVKLLGGPAAVSNRVVEDIQLVTGVAPERVWGPDRYLTAAAVVADAFPGTADTVYVATGASFPDALAGSAAAAQVDAPVLLTAPDHLPAPIADQLRRLQPTTVKLLGGNAAVTEEVARQIELATGVAPQRLAGDDRYSTAAAVVADGFPDAAGTAYLATGESFPDALTGAAAAARAEAPVLLTASRWLPDAVVGELVRLSR